MSTLNEPLSKVKARLENWLMYGKQGSRVDDLALDLLNRAKDWLCEYRAWDHLIKTVALSLSGQSAVLPSDIQSILEVYVDTNGDGKPDFWYYLNHPDVAFRYTIEGTYNATTGQVLTISFPNNAAIPSAPRMKYASGLSDYTGADGELCYFPPNLLLRCAQKIFVEDKGKTGDSEQLLLNAFWEDLKRYESMVQHSNQALDLTVKNKFGMPIKIYGHQLDGSGDRTGYSPYPVATWFRGY